MQTETEFLCSVKGAELLSPAMTDASVCSMFKNRIDQALANPARTLKTVSAASSADWIKLAIRFSKPGTASAALVRKNGGRETVHPEIAVDVMDKPLGQRDVKKLADEVAKLVVGAEKR
jgi:hypothetical protein